tara:strand:- start:1918 stop:2073 length:156 start_codon:yes stop_codon:yes gene_type:complete
MNLELENNQKYFCSYSFDFERYVYFVVGKSLVFANMNPVRILGVSMLNNWA